MQHDHILKKLILHKPKEAVHIIILVKMPHCWKSHVAAHTKASSDILLF